MNWTGTPLSLKKKDNKLTSANCNSLVVNQNTDPMVAGWTISALDLGIEIIGISALGLATLEWASSLFHLMGCQKFLYTCTVLYMCKVVTSYYYIYFIIYIHTTDQNTNSNFEYQGFSSTDVQLWNLCFLQKESQMSDWEIVCTQTSTLYP